MTDKVNDDLHEIVNKQNKMIKELLKSNEEKENLINVLMQERGHKLDQTL